ncbi:GAF domain-containing protein [Pusillimonas minor]|uniref:GAF domain-containing protein n=1 Tax=Pusillimonas minor TaxID=2697024 RepID=A0A842HM38_9BURK|nr:GAF domain-containing protein [Pusillimonas minor]
MVRLNNGNVDPEFVTLCAWTRTVWFEGEWMDVETYLARRYGVVVSHGMSPAAQQQMAEEETPPVAQKQSVAKETPPVAQQQVAAKEPPAAPLQQGLAASASALRNPRRLAAVKATGLLDTSSNKSFDRLTKIGSRLIGAPATFISLVDGYRDFYLSHCGFGEPLASGRQLTGQTFCHFTIEREAPLVIPDTRAHPLYRDVPTVESLGVAAYLGAPLVLLSGEVIGAFCAIDFVPRAWTDAQIQDAVDLASLVITEIEARQMAIDIQKMRLG